jgi:flagellar biosynthesis protein FlhF
MEEYIEQGINRKACELKKTEKYKRPFHILKEKEIRTGGFLGLFSKPGVEVTFYFAPMHYKHQASYAFNPALYVSDVTEAKTRQYPASDLEEEKRKIIAAAGKKYDTIGGNLLAGASPLAGASGREASQQILDSLNELKEKIESGGKKEEHPSFTRASELLKENDFSEKYINRMLDKLRKELPLQTLDNFDTVQERLLQWIGESISIYKDDISRNISTYKDDLNRHRPGIMVLIGPTGVGKTTTISKLAANYGISTDEKSAVRVRLITIDGYRICAKEQLEKTGEMMDIPVSYVTGVNKEANKQELRKEIAICSEDTDLFLIDTIGSNPKDSSWLGKMKEILDGAGRNAHFHLVISATTKTSDIEDILRQFEPYNYRSVILTKMDETGRIGNLISALAEKKKPVSFITDGQGVPADIKKATIVHFLINLDGFMVNREKIEEHFPVGDADQFKWR